MKYKGVIFDLDGVIVSTDNCHYLAWKEMADKESIFFDRKINERLRGVSRNESLNIILEKSKKNYTLQEKNKLTEYKNNIYKNLIQKLTPNDILPGVSKLLKYLKKNNIKIAIGSSSKNTKIILNQIGLDDFFDAIVDGNDIKKSKPDPEVFILAGKQLNVISNKAIVVEDSIAGVESGLAAGMDVLAVGYASSYKKATYRLNNLDDDKVFEMLN